MWWLTWLLSAWGQDVLTYEAVRAVEHGQGHPSITFRPGVGGSLAVRLDCGPRSYSMDRSITPGQPVTLTLTGLPEGAFQCNGAVELSASDGSTGSMPLGFDVVTLGSLTWTWSRADLDLGAGTLRTHPSRPLSRAVLHVYGLPGRIEQSVADLMDPAQPMFAWSTDQEVLKLVVEGEDAHGFRSQLELSPWSYAIPHEDVVFASGSATIEPGEVAKLESTWGEIEATLAKYGAVVRIELYVAGCTDTVGAGDTNQALSERRARSIAEWFQSRGFPAKIHFQGLGERALAVTTPDETSEQANRRAIYLLAAQAPGPETGLPIGTWKPL